MTKAEDRAGELFDMLANGDFSSAEVIDRTGWAYSQFLKAVQKLRDTLAGDGDVINVVAEPQGMGEPWLYRLVAGKDITDEERSLWATRRIQDAERRLKTIQSVLATAATATDGRSKIGRKARIYHLHITRAIEDVQLIENRD